MVLSASPTLTGDITINASTNSGLAIVGTSGQENTFRMNHGGTANTTNIQFYRALQNNNYTWVDVGFDGTNYNVYGSMQAGASPNYTLNAPYSSGIMLFQINSVEKMRLDASGNLCLGTTSASPTSPDARLTVAGNISTTWGDYFIGTTYHGGGYQLGIQAGTTARELRLETITGDSSGVITFYTGAGTTERVRITASGNLQITDANYYLTVTSSTPYLNFDTNDYISYTRSTNTMNFVIGGSTIATMTSGFAAFYGPTSGTGYSAQFYNSPSGSQDIFLEQSNGSSSGTTGTMRVSKAASNNRSINATGTINASGADYAEYMVKAEGCGLLTKGDIAGVDADGNLTDKHADAHSFVIKSTNPSYVGGDSWSDGNPAVGPRPEPTSTEDEAEKAVLEAELVKWKERHEAARQTVDRIAFSGQVPVNVTGATVGDYIVPVAGPDGGIAGEAVTNPTFDQYRAAVGRVWKILEDGRAFVSVKVS
jgi:hypothetical protein